jgi:hypothetical protein
MRSIADAPRSTRVINASVRLRIQEGKEMFRNRSDVESFISEFELGCLPKHRWTHEAHVVAGFWYTWTVGHDMALATIRTGIKRHNEAAGTPNTDSSGYHETITRLYMNAIAKHVRQYKSASFEEALTALLLSPMTENTWPLRYFSRERLFSVEARRTWVEPDLLAPQD